MTVEQMAEKILALVIEKRGGVTYVEIMNRIGDEAKGNCCAEMRPNLLVWYGMSQTLVDAVNLLLKDGKIEWHSTLVLTYLADGAALRLPIAKSMPKDGFKKPRWMPVVFNLRKPNKKAA
jgi:hypothetical protein